MVMFGRRDATAEALGVYSDVLDEIIAHEDVDWGELDRLGVQEEHLRTLRDRARDTVLELFARGGRDPFEGPEYPEVMPFETAVERFGREYDIIIWHWYKKLHGL